MIRRYIHLATVASLFAACTTDPAVDRNYGDRGLFMRDSEDRTIIFHGLNYISAAKSNPDRLVPLSEADLDRMQKDWGFDGVRYLVFWDAIEPAPGDYDDDYLARVRVELDKLHGRGFLVILDFHQDVYSSLFCCDGAPAWAVRSEGESFNLQDQWFLNYFEPAVMRAWDNFWLYDQGEHADLQDHYVAMLAHTATRLGDHPAVLGFDLMNEPHPGSLFDVGESLGTKNDSEESRRFDAEFYTPFLQRAVDAIRPAAPDAWLFFEPRYGGPGAGARSHIGQLRDPRDGEPRLAYFPHLYSLVLEGAGAYDTRRDDTIARWEIHRAEEQVELGMPMAIGEFGLDHGWTRGGQFLAEVLDLADRMMIGWSYWSYDPGNWGLHGHDTETGESPIVDLFIRAWPRRIAGNPVSFDWDPESRTFELVYRAGPDATAATEIYLPARRYFPKGWDLRVPGVEPTQWTQAWDEAREVLSVRFKRGAPALRTIQVSPK